MKDTRKEIAQSWHELTWTQLVELHKLRRNVMSSSEILLREYEIVSGSKCLGRGQKPYEGSDNDIRAIGEYVRRCAEGKAGTVLYFEKEGEVSYVETVAFAGMALERLLWMRRTNGLMKLPEKFVVVGGETFALPCFVGYGDNVVRYGQYGDMQVYMMGLWSEMDRVAKGEGDEKMAERLMNSFVSVLLLPTYEERVKIDAVEEEDGYRWEKRRYVREYDRSEIDRIAEKVSKSGDAEWLFSLLSQLTQSALDYYHSRFPDLVSKGGGRKKGGDIYVNKIGTDNTVMKYAGYGSVEAVQREPVGVILERLDAIAKENKEYERIKTQK